MSGFGTGSGSYDAADLAGGKYERHAAGPGADVEGWYDHLRPRERSKEQPANVPTSTIADKTSRIEQLLAAIKDDAALAKLPAPEWLVRDWMPCDALAWSSGKPGSGKTMAAIDKASCVANGIPWHGHDTKQGPVLYVIAEGARGIAQRIEAWCIANEQQSSGVSWLDEAVQFGNTADVAALTEVARQLRPVLVVLDTQARVTVGLDEDNNSAMGPFVAALDQIRSAAGGATILVVHHEPHGAERLRGASALVGAAGAIIRCNRDGREVTITSVKQKDADDPPEKVFTLTPLASSVYLADTVRPIHGAADHIMSQLMSHFADTGVTSGDLMIAAGLTKPTYQRWLAVLKGQGQIVERREGKSNRLYPASTTGDRQLA